MFQPVTATNNAMGFALMISPSLTLANTIAAALLKIRLLMHLRKIQHIRNIAKPEDYAASIIGIHDYGRSSIVVGNRQILEC